MGLLDGMFGGGAGQQGLLAGSMSLLGAGGPSRMPVSLGQALGQAVGIGQKAFQDAQEFELQKQMRQAQLAEMRAKMDEAARQRAEQEFMRQTAQRFQTPGTPAQPGLPANEMDSGMDMGQVAGTPAGFNAQGFIDAIAARDPLQAADLRKKLIPEKKFTTVAPGAVLYDETAGKQVFTAPDKSKEVAPTDLAKLIAERDKWPVGHPVRKLYDAAITKVATHSPGVNVTYGAPVAGVDKNGNPVFFQPDKGGGAPAIIPGVAPPPAKPGEKQTNQITGIDSLGLAVDHYTKTLKSWKPGDTLNPDKRAEMGTAYNNMMLQAKEAYNLGVLNGPDFEILQQVVRNPMTLVGTITSNEALAKQATDLKREMNKLKAKMQDKKKTPSTDADWSIAPAE